MKQVPKHNVEPVFVDVKKPNFNYRVLPKFDHVHLEEHAFKKPRTATWRRVLPRVVGALVLVLLIIGGVGVASLGRTADTLRARGSAISEHLTDSLQAIKSFEPEAAAVSLEESKQELLAIDQMLHEEPEHIVLGTALNFVPILKDVGGFLSQLTQFHVDLIELSGLLTHLQENGIAYFQHDGSKLITTLTHIQEVISDIRTAAEDLRNKTTSLAKLGSFDRFSHLIQDKYLSYSTDLYALEDALNAFVALLNDPEEQRFILMFQNPSEMRPSGGFLGSYGDLTVRQGQMENLEVQDIYWPDHEMNFSEKLIPPEPLQRTTVDWGARDANWFFDFPTSAEAVMSLLERSKIYADHETTFAGAIAINTHVLEDVLRATGPIALPEYDMTLDADNVLELLQREVEEGRDKKPGENPKRVLSVLAPKLMETLNTLSDTARTELMDQIGSRVERKDIMIYLRDAKIAHLLRSLGIDGSVYALPHDFWGQYLAVVNANVAGGKSDAFIEESVEAWIDVATDGSSLGDVKVTRTHTGGDEEDAWYRAANKDYLTIYTNPGATPLFIKGATKRSVIVNEYDNSYEWYEPLHTIEASRVFLSNSNAWSSDAFGKKGFSAWLVTDADTSETMSMRYETPELPGFAMSPGQEFRVVYDRQSGVDTALKVTVSAPFGYVWEESGAPIYVFRDDDPDKRVDITLTLAKQFQETVIEVE